ncbi:hypothetical protein Ahy_A09g043717 [Arachis hypogaea]|uniref:Uncharacterized protein n=1 Tax=Arachis hypogaea TaxID=3818 RepID=A0A445BJ39_ARAHY|nr:hypothetical protein Ahy_A09g043717 [Arachis hypogaea]
MEGHNRTTCHVRLGNDRLEGRGIDIFEDDLDDQVNIEDDQVYYNVSLSAIQLYIDPSKPSSRLRKPSQALAHVAPSVNT